MVAGEGHLVGQLQQPSKLHPPLDALDGVRVEMGKSLGLCRERGTVRGGEDGTEKWSASEGS